MFFFSEPTSPEFPLLFLGFRHFVEKIKAYKGITRSLLKRTSTVLTLIPFALDPMTKIIT